MSGPERAFLEAFLEAFGPGFLSAGIVVFPLEGWRAPFCATGKPQPQVCDIERLLAHAETCDEEYTATSVISERFELLSVKAKPPGTAFNEQCHDRKGVSRFDRRYVCRSYGNEQGGDVAPEPPCKPELRFLILRAREGVEAE